MSLVRTIGAEVYPVWMRLLLFTVGVTFIGLITGSPREQPVLLQDITYGNVLHSLNREQYVNFLRKTDWYQTPISFQSKCLCFWSYSMITFFDLAVRKVVCFSANDWKALFTQIWRDYRSDFALTATHDQRERKVNTADCTEWLCPVLIKLRAKFLSYIFHPF